MKLLQEGFNPILNAHKETKVIRILKKETPILNALKSVFETIEVSTRTKRDIKYVLTDVEKAIIHLGLVNYPTSQVSRKTIKIILDAASNSPDRFNKNRSYLMILFSEL